MTSIDLFFLIATLCVIFITFFLCFMLLYAALILQKVKRALESAGSFGRGLRETVHDLITRLTGMKTALEVLGEGVRHFQTRAQFSSKKGKKEKKNKPPEQQEVSDDE